MLEHTEEERRLIESMGYEFARNSRLLQDPAPDETYEEWAARLWKSNPLNPDNNDTRAKD